MKILYLHQYFNTPEMSGGTRSYEMARRLVTNGHEVHMITSWRDQNKGKHWFQTEEAGIYVHWLPIPYTNTMGFAERIRAFSQFSLQAARKAASIQADIVFATSTPLTIALPAIYTAKRQKIPMVFEVRDLWPKLPIAMGALRNPLTRIAATQLEKWAYRHSKSIIALSPGMKQGIVSTGYPPEQIAVIPNSSDLALFTVPDTAGQTFRAQRPNIGSRPLAAYAGTFGLINGVGYMVELAKHLQTIDPTICILLVGDGKEYELVKRQAQQAKVLANNLFIEPSLAKKDIPGLLNAADVALGLFIDKSEMRDNSSNKFFDALAAGKPLMINYGGWQKDLLEQHQAGFVTWKMSPQQAAEALAQHIRDRQWLNSAGKAAKRLAEQQFSRDQLATQLEQVLSQTLANKHQQVAHITPDYA